MREWKASIPKTRGEQLLTQHIRMHWYEHGDVSLYENGKPFIWDEYETIICLRPCKPVVAGSNPAGGSKQ